MFCCRPDHPAGLVWSIGLKALILILCLFSVQVYAGLEKPCESSLESTQPELSIGVLVESPDGKLYLGLSSYLSSKHSRVIENLAGLHGIRKILWMGELRYRLKGDGHPVLVEANETSGLYGEIKAGKHLDGVDLVENHVDNLPKSLRAPHFKSWTYDNENLHLISELNGLKDIRHDLGSCFQLLVNAIFVLQNSPSPQKAEAIISKFKGERHRDIHLIRWVMNQVVISRNVTHGELAELEKILNYLEDGDAESISSDVDCWEIREQAWLILSLLSDAFNQSDVVVFRVSAD